MLSYAIAVAISDFRDGDAVLHRGLQINVVGPDAGRDGELELLGFGQAVGREIARVEWRRNDDLGVDELALKGAVLALLVGRGHEGVALRLEPLADAQLALGGAEQVGLLLGVVAAIVETE